MQVEFTQEWVTNKIISLKPVLEQATYEPDVNGYSIREVPFCLDISDEHDIEILNEVAEEHNLNMATKNGVIYLQQYSKI